MPASRAATAICSAPLRVAVEAGLGDEELRGTALDRLHERRPRRPARPSRRPTAADDAGRGAELAELARAAPPTTRPSCPPAFASAIDGPMMFVPSAAAGGGRRARPRPRRRRGCAATRSTSAIISASTAGSTVRMFSLPPSGESVALGEAVHADDGQVARLDPPRPLGHRAHEPALQLVDGRERAAEREHLVELGRRRVAQLARPRLDHRSSRRRCRRTRAGRSRTRAPVASATTTADPTAAAGRAPRSTPAAARCARVPAWTA